MTKHFKVISAGIMAIAIAASTVVTVFATGTDTATAAANDSAITATAAPAADKDNDNDGSRPALTDEQKAQMKADMDARMKTKLDALVAAGTITQEQADAAFAIIAATTGRIDFSALPAEVAAALKSSMGKGHDNVFSELTADQQTAVKAVMDESMNSALAALVTAGTITQIQSDAITAEPRDKTAMDTLTTDQRAAIRTAMDTARDAGLAALVTNGTLTQDQADRMAKGHGGHDGLGGPRGMGGMTGMNGKGGDRGLGGNCPGAPGKATDSGTDTGTTTATTPQAI